MNLINNSVGYKIGAENPDATDEELQDKCEEALTNGELQTSPDPNLKIEEGEDSYDYADPDDDYNYDGQESDYNYQQDPYEKDNKENG